MRTSLAYLSVRACARMRTHSCVDQTFNVPLLTIAKVNYITVCLLFNNFNDAHIMLNHVG